MNGRDILSETTEFAILAVEPGVPPWGWQAPKNTFVYEYAFARLSSVVGRHRVAHGLILQEDING